MKRAFIGILAVLAVSIVSLLALVHECAFGSGMGARYRDCRCLGFEWVWYDQSAADGPRKTLCLGIVQSRTCYQYRNGPVVDCGENE